MILSFLRYADLKSVNKLRETTSLLKQLNSFEGS